MVLIPRASIILMEEKENEGTCAWIRESDVEESAGTRWEWLEPSLAVDPDCHGCSSQVGNIVDTPSRPSQGYGLAIFMRNYRNTATSPCRLGRRSEMLPPPPHTRSGRRNPRSSSSQKPFHIITPPFVRRHSPGSRSCHYYLHIQGRKCRERGFRTRYTGVRGRTRRSKWCTL